MTENLTSTLLIEQSIEILGASRDGEDLHPAHLSLVEAAANNNLNKAGVLAFQKLHADVSSGKYIKPWLAGVEHVTCDLRGYVYWKGIRLEHFTFSCLGAAKLKILTTEFAESCRHIEALDLPVNTSTYYNSWLDKMPLEFPKAYRDLLHLTKSIYEHPDGRLIFPLAERCEEGQPNEARFLEVKNGNVVGHRMPLETGRIAYDFLTATLGYRLAQCGQPEHTGPEAATLAQVMDWFRTHGVSEQVARCLADQMQAG